MRITVQKNSLDLSVVIPTLHEAANLRILLPQLRESLTQLGISWEILVVDGDSKDGSQEIAEAEGARYILEKRPGYGVAILRGVSEAHGTYVQTMDADLSHPTQFIEALWQAREKADLIIASRYVEGGQADQPWFRLQLSRVLNAFFRKGLSVDVQDMSSGFRLYRKSLFHGIDFQFTNFVILLEILLRAYEKGMRIAECPFHYKPRTEGQSHARILKFGIDYLRLFRRVWALRNSVEFPDYDWRAYHSRIWFQRYWQHKRHHIILQYASDADTICDIGCGSSHILADLPHAIGLDLRHDKLAFMRRYNPLLVGGDGMALPFADNTFSCVISSQVIEHIPHEKGRHLDELMRILKPGGILILGTPDYGGWQWPLIEWFYGKIAPGAYADEHVNPYTRTRLEQALQERNCAILDCDYICHAELILKARKEIPS